MLCYKTLQLKCNVFFQNVFSTPKAKSVTPVKTPKPQTAEGIFDRD